MKSLVQLFNDWEIQLLVLLSFTLQFFLFFAGGLRRGITNGALRLLIWLAYLGADWVAVYALGLICRIGDTTAGTHQLALLWAPFLLIHLGGQDTITAFSIEDNKLWRRHLLNLVVQVSLTLYIFWKSANGPNIQLLVQSMLLFVTGTIKYGERTWALWHGSLTQIESSDVPDYLPSEMTQLDVISTSDLLARICALVSMGRVLSTFYGISYTGITLGTRFDMWSSQEPERPDLSTKLLEIVEIQLGLMFDDIYTKAKVFRTWGGIILRWLSQISFFSAFLLFSVRHKERYNPVDTALTYGLFIGGFSLEVSSAFVTMMSPWIWAWLKSRNCSFLASIIDRWQRKRVLWSNSIGQYNIINDYLGHHDQRSSTVMAAIRKMVNAICGKKHRFWISKLFDTNFIEVDEKTMRCVRQRIASVEFGSVPDVQLPNLSPLLKVILPNYQLESIIIFFHMYTEVQLSKYAPTRMDSGSSDALVRVCRTISNYMVYLLATHPEMLPVREGGQSTIEFKIDMLASEEIPRQPVQMLTALFDLPESLVVAEFTEALLLEIQEVWVGLLIYAAGKSRPEMHVALLARGGELLTFVWLLMAHYSLGDSAGYSFEMTSTPSPRHVGYYAFHLPQNDLDED